MTFRKFTADVMNKGWRQGQEALNLRRSAQRGGGAGGVPEGGGGGEGIWLYAER